jgi:hypothetical protein
MLFSPAPKPSVMPLDRDLWKQQLHLSQFINTYYQYRDLNACIGSIGKVLIIGPGAGLDAAVLRWKGYEVTTFDIDEKFSPDILGSCHDMHMFSTKQFDAVIASHVLEHLPVPYLEMALSEISRVSKYALIFLPIAGKHIKIDFGFSVFRVRLMKVFDAFRFWKEPCGEKLEFGDGFHYWEIGYRKFRVNDFERRLSHRFKVLESYRNTDWIPSYNFVLQSKLL